MKTRARASPAEDRRTGEANCASGTGKDTGRTSTAWTLCSQAGGRGERAARKTIQTEIAMADDFDVIIAGSGAAGMTAALRASELGLKVLVVEKAHKYGGTSATSGGVIWIPNHGLGTDDSREQALRYFDAVATGPVQRDRLEAFIDTGPRDGGLPQIAGHGTGGHALAGLFSRGARRARRSFDRVSDV